jgi:hypothetical protein
MDMAAACISCHQSHDEPGGSRTTGLFHRLARPQKTTNLATAKETLRYSVSQIRDVIGRKEVGLAEKEAQYRSIFERSSTAWLSASWMAPSSR